MGRSTETCTVVRTDDMDPETAVIRYQKRRDGWYVQTPADAEFRPYVQPDASERTVIQLINKEFDARYGDPAPFEEADEEGGGA